MNLTEQQKSMHRDVMLFHDRFIGMPNEPKYWEAAGREMQRVSLYWKEDPFVMDMLIAVYNQLEREVMQK